ncbi:zinc finger protein ZFAT [Diretmus argenteus]
MDGQKAAGSMFMCRLCNLFSPSHSQLLAHCSQLHPQQEPPDDIIVALQPLPAGPVAVETITESPVKRKRGRPKGSTKKRRPDLIEGKTTRSPEEKDKREEDRRREEKDRQGDRDDGILGLECRKCHRSFSNRRQILKHICLKEEEEEEEEENDPESISGAAGVGGSGSLDPGADPNHTHQNPARLGLTRAKEVDGFRAQRTNRRRIRIQCVDRNPTNKEGGLAAGNRKSVINVVLTEHETLPGAIKMVPVEASPAETDSAATQTQPQDSAACQAQTHDSASHTTAYHNNPDADPEPSPNPASKSTAARGFQEYSIKQVATSLIQSQLKIFTCEFCNKIFKFRHSLIAHLRTHTQEKPFQCPHCNYASAIKANLNVHLRKHTGEKFSCQHCPFTCLSPGHLKVHIERVHLKVKQHCGFCQKKYSDVKNLLKHMEHQHNLKDPAVHQSYQQLRLKTRQGQRQLLYHCPTCNRRFKNQLERERHLLVHGPQRPFACLLCDHATTKMAALAAHVRKHLFLYVCCQCRGKFVSSQRLKSHLKESHPDLAQEQAFTDCINNSYYLIQPGGDGWRVSEAGHQSAFQQVVSSLQKTQLNMETFQRLRKIYGDLECQYCGKLFWYKVHYNLHVRTHTKEHMHYCSQCSYSSITKSCLKRHLIQKHSGLLLPCPNTGCKYTTPDKYKLQAHLKTHQEQGKNVACPVCHQNYPENRLKNHINTSHPDTGPKGLMVKRAEKCPYCDSYFLKNSSDLQQHIWAHQGLKPYRCSVCDYAGRSKSNLKTHMNRHSTERSHLCDLCGKKFKSKVTLKSHRLSHTTEGKQFHCSECDYTSVSKPALLRHMEQHAEFKPFRCAHCHYSCNIAGPLKRHYSKKHPEQEYQNAGPGLPNPDTLEQQGGMKCPVCEFVYGTKWELNRHLKNKHNLKLVEGHSAWEVVETVEEQYAPVEDEAQQTEAAVAALQDNNNVNILQQIIELSSESHDAVASVVTMAPGTVTVVEQVADEQEAGNRSDQLMVVDGEESRNGEQLMVVEETEGLEALTVFTQGENTHHYIVYVQEQTVEIN